MFMTPEGAIIGNMGKELRKDETLMMVKKEGFTRGKCFNLGTLL